MSSNKDFTRNRHSTSVLGVTRSGVESSRLRQALRSLGFDSVITMSSHVQGVERLRTGKFSLVLFDAKTNDLPALNFVEQALALDPTLTLIALSNEPKIDDVFSLLKAGSAGFVVMPYTIDTLEAGLQRAGRESQFTNVLRNVDDRNTALSMIILNNLARLATAMRFIRENNLPEAGMDHLRAQFVESVEMGIFFCEGSGMDLREKIMKECISRADVARTRLGRTREILRRQREQGEVDISEFMSHLNN